MVLGREQGPHPGNAMLLVLVALIGGAIVLASAMPGADRPGPTAGPPTGSLAFTRGEGGSAVIAVAAVATGRPTEILAVDGAVEGLDWSPDGASLVFGVQGEGGGVFVAHADGSGVRRIAAGTMPAWSPDGARIAYRADDGEIHVMAADGSDDVVLTDVGWTAYPDWSPDGHTLAFVGPGPRGHRDGSDVYTSNEDGSIVSNLTSHPAIDTQPAWSPTGGTILFRTNRAMESADAPLHEQLFQMNAEGGNLIRLTDDTTVTHAPTWSPDGTRIAFDDGRAVFVANADGSGITRVVDGVSPAWRPVVEAPDASHAAGTPSASSEHDPGLGFDVCDATHVMGRFDGATEGTVYVASRMTGGRCPAVLNAPQVVAVDVDGDGSVDATFDSPTCQDWCTAWAAPDVDGDGTAELLVQTAQFSIAGVQLYEVGTDPPEVAPVTVRSPGEAGFAAGQPPQFWHGVDGYNAESLTCSGGGSDRVLVASTAYQNPPESGPWAIHRITLRLEGAKLQVTDVRDLETEELSLHDDDGTVCGAPIRQAASGS